MLHAVSFALLDSVNVLLIGIVVVAGVMLQPAAYRRIAPALIIGDWLGVFGLAVVVLFIFSGLEDFVHAALASPIYAWVLGLAGVVSIAGAWRSKGGEAKMIGRLLGPLRTLSWQTVVMGVLLGAIQSATSVPFYVGLLHLGALQLSAAAQIGAVAGYATLALSLPVISAFVVAWASRSELFSLLREKADVLVKAAGYLVGAILIVMALTS